MEKTITQIIENAKNMKKHSQISDYKIAEYVHIELGKIIYYDNNYTSQLNDRNEETSISNARKKTMLKLSTNKSSNAQICKGMAEIYAEILNEIGIEAKAIGVEKKGEIQELTEDEAKHYCTLFKINGKEYVQDYLIEAALMRIKTGEIEFSKEIPGICTVEDYTKRGTRSLAEIGLSSEFLKGLLVENIDNLNDNDILNIIFNKLNDYFINRNSYFGFEEAKDFVFLIARNFIHDKSGIKIINLVKEDENSCGVICVYDVRGQKYLVRGSSESTDIPFSAGKITDVDLKEIQIQGYCGRSSEEREYLNTNQFKRTNQTLSSTIISSGVKATEEHIKTNQINNQVMQIKEKQNEQQNNLEQQEGK